MAVVVFLLTLVIVSTLQVAVLGGAAAGTVVWVAGLVVPGRPPQTLAPPQPDRRVRRQNSARHRRVRAQQRVTLRQYNLLGAGVDPAFEFAATEGEHSVPASSHVIGRRRRKLGAAAAARPGRARASTPGRRPAPATVSAPQSAGCGSHGALAGLGPKPNGGASPDHGSGTRQPSRPTSVRPDCRRSGPVRAVVRAGPRPPRGRAPRPGRRTPSRAAPAAAARRRGRGGGRVPGRAARRPSGRARRSDSTRCSGCERP